MSRTVTVYFSLASPWAYLGWRRLREITDSAGASVVFRPIQMATVFKATGGLPLAERPKARRHYRLMELRRWRDRLGIPIHLEPRFFPVDERQAARMVIAAGLEGGDVDRLSEAFLRAVWEEQRNIADRATRVAIAAAESLDGEALEVHAGSAVLAGLQQSYTEAAIAAGVFGVPSYVLDEELFWGQDRLDFVQRALR